MGRYVYSKDEQEYARQLCAAAVQNKGLRTRLQMVQWTCSQERAKGDWGNMFTPADSAHVFACVEALNKKGCSWCGGVGHTEDDFCPSSKNLKKEAKLRDVVWSLGTIKGLSW